MCDDQEIEIDKFNSLVVDICLRGLFEFGRILLNYFYPNAKSVPQKLLASPWMSHTTGNLISYLLAVLFWNHWNVGICLILDQTHTKIKYELSVQGIFRDICDQINITGFCILELFMGSLLCQSKISCLFLGNISCPLDYLGSYLQDLITQNDSIIVLSWYGLTIFDDYCPSMSSRVGFLWPLPVSTVNNKKKVQGAQQWFLLLPICLKADVIVVPVMSVHCAFYS